MNLRRILLIFIEPTPYIVGLIRSLDTKKLAQIDILFLNENKSQSWNLDRHAEWIYFPDSFIGKVKLLYQIIFKKNYQIIHVAGWREYFILSVIFFAKCNNISVTVESDTPYHLTSHWKHSFKKLLYPVIFRFIDFFLPGGSRQADYIASFHVPRSRIYPVQMTIDVDYFRQKYHKLSILDKNNFRQLYKIPDNHCIFLFVGRLEVYKGILDLIQACESIHNASLVIIGDGSLRNVIEQASMKNKNVIYTGRLTGDALIKAYYASDVFVLPSHFEPWGLVINEAMAMKLPVIVSDKVGCLDDLVIPNETGLIFTSGNIEMLKSSMTYMMDITNRTRMSSNASNHISSWTLENEATNMFNAWNKLSYN